MKGNTSFYSDAELAELGLGSYGENVLISRKCSIYSPEKIHIGNNVRIDDFCILSGRIRLGNYIHISAYCALYGGEQGIFFDDYSGISARGTVYAEVDDFSGEFLTNPMVPRKYRHIEGGAVHFGKYCQVGAGCVVLPNSLLGEGSAVGAMSLIVNSLPGWGIYVGIPARLLKRRKMDISLIEL